MFAKHIMTQNFYGTCLALSPFIVQSTTMHKEAGCNQSSMSSNISQTGGNLQLLRFPFLSLWCDECLDHVRNQSSANKYQQMGFLMVFVEYDSIWHDTLNRP
jgi:hypothetical protein